MPLSAGGRLAGPLVCRLVPCESDTHKLDSFLGEKRTVSALWRRTFCLPLADLRCLPTLGAARSRQPRRREAMGCSIAKRRASALLRVATAGGCAGQPGFCATGRKEWLSPPGKLGAAGLVEERRKASCRGGQDGAQQGQTRVGSTRLAWCTAQPCHSPAKPASCS